MKMFSSSLLTLLLFALSNVVNAVTLSVSTTGGNTSSPLLYGIMFEDINHSGDGGIHGQLLQNNGFQGTSPGLTAYSAVGSTTLSVNTDDPLSSAIPNSLEVSVPSGTTGQVGFANSGYEGVPVNADTYANYFWIKGTYSGNVILSLYSNTSGTVWGTKTLAVTSNSSEWTYYETTYTATQSVDENNAWKLTFDASQVAGSALYFDLVQLFPVTYHARYNGLRNDVATFLETLEPSFLRFPGGNNLEGATPADRWQWNLTIGAVQDRPGRQGDWGYPNTDALGLMEYLQWCTDMGMEPVLAVWSGLSLGGGIVSGTALDPYVTDILNELEFLLGDTTTTYGALRASLGHSDPYSITMIEVGNEDQLNSGCSTYASRFTAIYNAIHAAYPNITVIASTTSSSCLPSPLPANVWTDIHFYTSPNTMVSMFNYFDNVARGNGYGIFVGEYATTTDNSGATTYWSQMEGSVGEAVFMIGLERNSDLVKMASYAPLLEHYNITQWSPDLLGVYSKPGSITGSTSFYVQQLFSIHRGTTILPVTSDTAFGPVYWVASQTSASSPTYYVKLANYGSTSQSVTIEIPSASLSTSATLITVSGAATQANYPLDVTVLPVTSTITGTASGGYTVTLPAWGVGVLTLTTS